MSISSLPGLIIVAKDGTTLAQEAARRLGHALREAIAARGAASLALSGGNTPRPAYEALAREPGVDWPKVSVFWIDERAVPPDHERSNYRLANESLLSRAPIPPANVHRMKGESTDLAQAAKDYEALLRAKLPLVGGVPVLDAAVVGMGDDGHTASLFPGDTTMDVRDRAALPVAAAPEKQREARLTVTTPVLEQIRNPLMLVAGKAKHGPLLRVAATDGDVHQTPSRLYRGVKGSLVWILDTAALDG